jgi:hypothetical protein
MIVQNITNAKKGCIAGAAGFFAGRVVEEAATIAGAAAGAPVFAFHAAAGVVVASEMYSGNF